MDHFMEHITQCIASWTDSGKSFSSLARTLGIPNSTLARVRDKVNEASFEVLEALLPIVDQELALQYAQRRYPSKVQSLQQAVKRNFKACRALQELMQKGPYYFCVIRLCATIQGISLDSVKRNLGAAGEAVLDELIEKDLAYLRPDGKIHLFQKLFQVTSFEMIAKQVEGIQKVLPHYSPEGLSAKVEAKAYSSKGLAKAMEILKRLYEEFAKLDDNPDYHGDHLYIFGMISGSLRRESPE